MNKRTYLLTTLAGVLAVLAVLATADVIPTYEWVNFIGVATFNGKPTPVGSIIDAFDPTGVHCGRFYVGSVVDSAGVYGFLPVYRDDKTAPDTIDEGAEPGDTISFKINDRSAMVVYGDPFWTSNGDTHTVDLVATGFVILTPVVLPMTQTGAPGDTVRFWVGVRNDGDGLDFYRIRAASDSSGNNAWSAGNQDSLSYADVGDTVYLYFDIIIAPFAAGDTVFHINYSVWSCLDTAQRIDTTVDLIKLYTDVPEDLRAELPGGFRLNQNYPNPFNPTTTISFTLFHRSTVRLQVLNLLGRVIHARDFGTLASGEHSFDYDANGVPTGVYFYRLETATGSQTRKMIVLK